MKDYLRVIGRIELFDTLMADRNAWRILAARTPGEKGARAIRKMEDFRRFVCAKSRQGRSHRRFDRPRPEPHPAHHDGNPSTLRPRLGNLSPAALPSSCPTGIPVQKRWEMIRKGLVDESVDIALAYTPFPVTVCGYLCPNVCMQHCTRQIEGLKPVDITVLGKASLKAKPPEPAETTGYKVAIVGAGPAGLSIAWQLYLKGHQPVVFDRGEERGKITSSIPSLRIPDEIVRHDIRPDQRTDPDDPSQTGPQQHGLRKAPRRVRLRCHRRQGPRKRECSRSLESSGPCLPLISCVQARRISSGSGSASSSSARAM